MANNIKNKKIIIIGGCGFIGLHLAKRLSSLDCDLIILYRSNLDKVKNLDFTKKIKFIKGNIKEYKDIEKSIKDKDIIINFAAVVNPTSDFELYQDLEVNCKGQFNILEARKNINPDSKYLFLGSRTQFGRVKKEDLPIPEDYCQRPISLYGIHKQTSENYCKLYKRTFNLQSTILRLPQVYGPSLTKEKTHSIIDKFVKKALKNEKFYVNGYGKDIKDLIYIDDVIDLIIKILNSNIKEGIFNVGSGEKVQLIDIAKKIVKLCNSGSFEAVPFPEDLVNFELGSFFFDISKASKEFDWKPKISLDEGIKRVIDFYKNME